MCLCVCVCVCVCVCRGKLKKSLSEVKLDFVCTAVRFRFCFPGSVLCVKRQTLSNKDLVAEAILHFLTYTLVIVTVFELCLLTHSEYSLIKTHLNLQGTRISHPQKYHKY